MDLETMALIGAPIAWVGDRISPADVKPRHIGRVVTADALENPEDLDNHGTYRVIGTLTSVVGDSLFIDGHEFDYSELQNVRVWRREVKR